MENKSPFMLLNKKLIEKEKDLTNCGSITHTFPSIYIAFNVGTLVPPFLSNVMAKA